MKQEKSYSLTIRILRLGEVVVRACVHGAVNDDRGGRHKVVYTPLSESTECKYFVEDLLFRAG